MSGRRTVGAVAAAICAVVLAVSGWGAMASAAGDAAAVQRDTPCGDADAGVDDVVNRALRKAVLCLSNKARAQQGAERVGRDPELQKAAQRHAEVMSEADCLTSRCPGEPDLEARIRKAGYFDGARRWGYAENTGCAVSAEAMVESWLESSFHRANILEAKSRDLGVGVVEKGPASRCEAGLAVFSAVFAWRKD